MTPDVPSDPRLSTGRRRSEVLPPAALKTPNGKVVESFGRGKRGVYSSLSREKRPLWVERAVEQGDAESLEALLTYPHVCRWVRSRGEDLLIGAVRLALLYEETPEKHAAYLAIVRLVLRAGANPDACGQTGTPVLVEAALSPSVRRALLDAGANPLAKKGNLPLLYALYKGDAGAAVFWWGWGCPVVPGGPNPWSALWPHLSSIRYDPGTRLETQAYAGFERAAGDRYGWGSFLSFTGNGQRSAEMSPEKAWEWARRLVNAGVSLDAPFGNPVPEDPNTVAQFETIRKENTAVQDTPLVRACLRGDADSVCRFLDLGAHPHRAAPNGRHPFAAWVSGSIESLRWLPDKMDVFFQVANRLFSATLARHCPSSDQGFPTYQTTHPVACLLGKACASPWPAVQSWGWAKIDALVSAGARCPIPQDAKTSSVLDRAVSWVLTHDVLIPWSSGVFPYRKEECGPPPEDGPETWRLWGDPRWRVFVETFPGLREAWSIPCADRYGVPGTLITLAAEGDPRMTPQLFERLERWGLNWAAYSGFPDSECMVSDRAACRPLGCLTSSPLPHLAQKPVVPFPLPLLCFFLNRCAAHGRDAEVSRGGAAAQAKRFIDAFQFVIHQPHREGQIQCLSALVDAGLPLDNQDAASPWRPDAYDSWIHWAVRGASESLTDEVLRFFHARSFDPSVIDTAAWPERWRLLWRAWCVAEQLGGTVATPAVVSSRSKARL